MAPKPMRTVAAPAPNDATWRNAAFTSASVMVMIFSLLELFGDDELGFVPPPVFRSPGGAERNPGSVAHAECCARSADRRYVNRLLGTPGCAPLHPGYGTVLFQSRDAVIAEFGTTPLPPPQGGAA